MRTGTTLGSIASCLIASIAVTQGARAEANPGQFEVVAGADAMAIGRRPHRCQRGLGLRLVQGFVVGFELQGQMLLIPAIDMPAIDGFERDNPMFPYLAFGGHAGYRW